MRRSSTTGGDPLKVSRDADDTVSLMQQQIDTAALRSVGREMRLVLGIVVATLAGAGVIGCSNGAATSAKGRPGCVGSDAARPCRVLFIGNSYTYVNDLPVILAELAHAGNHVLKPGILAEAGETLADHAASRSTTAALSSTRWNIVVLQEQSEIPSVEYLRQNKMYPAARQLVRMIRDSGAQPMLYLTWAHRYGWPENSLPSYSRMQSAIDSGYTTIARALNVTVARVGDAWSAEVSHEPRLRLWRLDGSHPTVKGTYLTACVFYATIFHESPEGLRYHANLSTDDASQLQAIASETVLGPG